MLCLLLEYLINYNSLKSSTMTWHRYYSNSRAKWTTSCSHARPKKKTSWKRSKRTWHDHHQRLVCHRRTRQHHRRCSRSRRDHRRQRQPISQLLGRPIRQTIRTRTTRLQLCLTSTTRIAIRHSRRLIHLILLNKLSRFTNSLSTAIYRRSSSSIFSFILYIHII